MRDLAGQSSPGSGGDAWSLGLLAATALAVDPHGLGGAVLRAWPGPARDAWLEAFRALIPEGAPWRRLPPATGDDRALGALDLAATLACGRPMAEPGVLGAADGGVVIVPGAERLERRLGAHLGAALDRGAVPGPMTGPDVPARLGVVLLDEGAAPDERAPAALADRLAFRVGLEGLALGDLESPVATRAQVAAARRLLAQVAAPEDAIEALTRAALALGISDLRAVLLAMRAARVFAALDARMAPGEPDLALAAQVVLAPRATRLPEEAPDEEAAPPPETQDTPEPPERAAETEQTIPEEMLVAAAMAVLPRGVLDALRNGARQGGAAKGGAAGAHRASPLRGRPIGTRPGVPGDGRRLALLETLRAAAPWQPLRRRAGRGRGLEIRRADFRIRRFKERRESLTIFAVDASGSSAVARLAEAKGAIELLLGEAYQRRDEVALVSFRRESAETLLPPTRALARARRALTALPGGGGTPLGAGIDAARLHAEAALRRGQTPTVVLLTDGKANVARDGGPGRAHARADAEAAAAALRAAGIAALLIDISPRPGREGPGLAAAMGAQYLALPRGDAHTLAAAVEAAR